VAAFAAVELAEEPSPVVGVVAVVAAHDATAVEQRDREVEARRGHLRSRPTALVASGSTRQA
jgi:hypothetical protein